MRYSKQRELVLHTVEQLCDHPTAEEIFGGRKEIREHYNYALLAKDYLKILTDCEKSKGERR